jgi:hypothetical protein
MTRLRSPRDKKKRILLRGVDGETQLFYTLK